LTKPQIVVIAAVSALVVRGLFLDGDQNRGAPPPTTASAPATLMAEPMSVATAKGQFTVPGKGFADGRDLEARPPLTVIQINVWDATARRKRLCEVRHGDQLELLEAKREEAEDRYYFQIRSKACVGWLPEPFISPRAEKIVGDRH
jgi:hypothetical protein